MGLFSVGGEVWLRSLPPTASWGGTAAADRPLQLVRRATSTGTHPTLGPYNETRFIWTAPGCSSTGRSSTGGAAAATSAAVPVETAILQFEGGGTNDQMFLLEQSFPEGLAHCNASTAGSLSRPLLAFPNFARGGGSSRRRDCHLMAPPVPLSGVSIAINRGCHQNDSLADG